MITNESTQRLIALMVGGVLLFSGLVVLGDILLPYAWVVDSSAQGQWMVSGSMLLLGLVLLMVLALVSWRQFQRIEKHIQDLNNLRISCEEAVANANAANEAKGHFLANMSHEIRTPLNAIVGLSYLALQDTLEVRTRDYLEKIVRATNVMIPVINDILDFSKIEAGKLELELDEFELSIVFDQAIEMLEDLADQKGISIRRHFSSDLPAKVMGDPVRVSQILTNFGSNAIKFSNKGEVVFGAKLLQQTDSTTELLFWVKDEGIGIDEVEQAFIFNPFKQAASSTTRRFGGTGLGLAISWKLANLMGGRVWVESLVGQGSTFYFQVTLGTVEELAVPPASLNPINSLTAAAKEAPALYPRDHFQGIRILLVEDNLLNQDMTKELLLRRSMKVDVVSNGKEAIDRMEAGHPYELILMDCHMPLVDGFEATRRIRLWPGSKDVPIIAMTADVIGGAKQRAIASGMNDFVSKPVDFDELLSKIDQWAPRLRNPSKAGMDPLNFTDEAFKP